MVHLKSRRREAGIDPCTQLAVCNNFLQEIKNHGVQIRLRLSGDKYDSTLFAGAYRNVGTYDFDDGPSKSATISDWHLETIGNLVDELQLYWDLRVPYSEDNEADRDWTAWGNARDRKYDAILQQRIAERYELETKLVCDFFDRLPTVLPNVTTIKLRVPSDLYRTVVQKANPDITNNDAWYASILPGTSGWRVIRGEDESGCEIEDDSTMHARTAEPERKFLNRTGN